MTCARPHPHAAERVAFMYGRLAVMTEPLILITRYVPVPDQQYVIDPYVGARINGDAIRAAMQGCLDTGDGVFPYALARLAWQARILCDR